MSENTEQQALFHFLATMEGRYPALRYVFHPANEANGGGAKVRHVYTRRDGSQGWKTTPVEAIVGARMGVKAGCWDIWVPFRNRAPVWGYPALMFAGLVIEMKSKTGALSPEQSDWREFLRGEGWACQVYRDWTDAGRTLLAWAGGDLEEVQGL
jgi:hypothetical protein